RERGPGHATAPIRRHAQANQQAWATGVSAKMLIKKIRNGLGPRIQVLRAMGQWDQTTGAPMGAWGPAAEALRLQRVRVREPVVVGHVPRSTGDWRCVAEECRAAVVP